MAGIGGAVGIILGWLSPLRDAVNNIHDNVAKFKPKAFRSTSKEFWATSSSDFETAINVNGAGMLYGLSFVRTCSISMDVTFTLKVTLDGVTMQIANESIPLSKKGTVITFPLNYHFVESCKVEAQTRISSGSCDGGNLDVFYYV
ncbi:MAG: hypothetical protein WCY82_10765 [Desulfotomaculaceae bacterium]